MIRLGLFLLLAGALVAYAFRVYLRAELPVRGRRLLAAARAGSSILILALLFDPSVPRRRSAAAPDRWALVDVSRSMTAGGGRAWNEARRVADSLASRGWRIVPFGGEGPSSGRLPDAPGGTRTLLAPALERAAESGVRRATVLSDLRFEDAAEAEAALAVTPVHVTFRDVGADVVNAGIARFRVADAAHRGDTIRAGVELFATGAGDSVALEIREEDRLVLTRMVGVPSPGRIRRETLTLPPARESGWVRYRASVHVPGDAFPSDDTAVAYASVGAEKGGLVVVSLHPDWEPRALLPALEEATGLTAEGYLRVGENRFTPMGRAMERGAPVDSAAVRRLAAAALVLVVHGLDAGTDAWGRALPEQTPRALLWPLDAEAAARLGVHAGAPRGGEWYVSPRLPSSPLAPDLSGAELRDVPPLTGVLPVTGAAPGSVPLQLQLQGSGLFRPALVLRQGDGRRQAVVLASGFWRWQARDGAGRDAYRRLWSGVAGWLLTEGESVVAGEPRPDRRVYGSGEPITWRIPGGGGDSARLSILGSARTVLDTTVAAGPSVAVPALPAGSYGYRIRGPGDREARGRFDVEARTLEMLPPRAVPAVPDSARTMSVEGERRMEETRPLRTALWPYLLILGLLCAEWVGRRRAGLR